MDRQNNEFFIISKNILYCKQFICMTIESSEERLLQNEGVTGGIFGYMTYIFICLMCSNLIVMLFIGSKFKARQ